MGHRLLEILIPALISALLLWEAGVYCRKPGYSLKAPSQVTVQDGFCLDIPCRFTYSHFNNDLHAKLYGYWYKEDNQHRPHLMATNDPERINEIDYYVRHRFEMSETKLKQNDCSFTITGAKATDKGAYHFRIAKGYTKYSYNEEKVYVNVAERKPDITFFGPLRAGQKQNIFCKAPRCPNSEVPQIIWTRFPQDATQKPLKTVNRDSVESRMDFIPTAAHHKQNITCQATYGEGLSHRIVERTLTLDIRYAPTTPRFTGILRKASGSVKEINSPHVEAQQGDSLLLRCEADANPTGNVTWTKITKLPTAELPISNNELKLSGLRLEDDATYKCQVKNQEGSITILFHLQVKGQVYNDDIVPRAE